MTENPTPPAGTATGETLADTGTEVVIRNIRAVTDLIESRPDLPACAIEGHPGDVRVHVGHTAAAASPAVILRRWFELLDEPTVWVWPGGAARADHVNVNVRGTYGNLVVWAYAGYFDADSLDLIQSLPEDARLLDGLVDQRKV